MFFPFGDYVQISEIISEIISEFILRISEINASSIISDSEIISEIIPLCEKTLNGRFGDYFGDY